MNYINPAMLIQSYKNQNSLDKIFKPKEENPKDSIEKLPEAIQAYKNKESFEIPKINLEEIFNNTAILKIIIFILIFIVMYMFFQIKSLRLENKFIMLSKK